MKKVERRISFEKYSLALCIAILFFIFGFFIGNYIVYQKSASLKRDQQAIMALVNLLELKDEAVLKGKGYCNLTWSDIWEEKVAIGEIVMSLETRLKKTNKEVIEQKKLYNDVQLRTLNLVEKVNEECDYSWDIFIFFYTNDKKDEKGDYRLSEFQGRMLDTIYKIYPEKAKVFAVDWNVDNNSTRYLIEKYNITSTPSMVINGEKYERFINRPEIEEIISE